MWLCPSLPPPPSLYPSPVNGISRLTYFNIWRSCLPGRRTPASRWAAASNVDIGRTNRFTWQVPGSQVTQSVAGLADHAAEKARKRSKAPVDVVGDLSSEALRRSLWTRSWRSSHRSTADHCATRTAIHCERTCCRCCHARRPVSHHRSRRNGLYDNSYAMTDWLVGI